MRPAWAPLTLVAFVALVICTNVASAVWAKWVNTNPEGLLDPVVAQSLSGADAGRRRAGRHLRADRARCGSPPPSCVCHLIGRAYHDDALGWFTQVSRRDARRDRRLQPRLRARRNGSLIPFFAGSNIVAALSGVHRTPPGRSWSACWPIGIAGRLAADLVAGAHVRRPAGRRSSNGSPEYQWWAVGISIASSCWSTCATSARLNARGQTPCDRLRSDRPLAGDRPAPTCACVADGTCHG